LFLFFLETLVPPLPGLRTFATTFPALTHWATLANARGRACRRWSMEVPSDFEMAPVGHYGGDSSTE